MDLDKLHPDFVPLVKRVLVHVAHLAELSACSWYVASTWRDPAKQMTLFKKGREKVGGVWTRIPGHRVVTNAMPQDTPHCVTIGDKPASCAIDIALVSDAPGGRVWLSDDDPRWGIVPAAVALTDPSKLVSGAMWSSLRDWPHVQLKNWRSYVGKDDTDA